ncbi:UNVERIFIED_CONTAM: KxYKxGKxW signal peptide domain-containing protein [Streptococcus canis]|uniref:KxYKxGKxW signal peptide domain-containing protein n=1 Tax=Streptococcus canis TaxID=1329 RepID=UPI0024DE4742|nr:KxYKxGKxW signal peptide domain-containing protein [Streptococcus canis]
MNKLKGKFRTWKSGKHWMYAGAMVILATGMCTGKVTLAETCFLESQITSSDSGTYLDREEETHHSQFAQGSQDGYDDAKNNKERKPKESEGNYTLGYNYGYDYGQKERAKQDAREEALQDEEAEELDRVDVQFEEASQSGFDDGLDFR